VSRIVIGLTPEQHRELGMRLGRLKCELHEVFDQMVQAYPRKRGPLYWTLRLIHAADMLCFTLDREMAREHPDMSWEQVYYGIPADTRWS